MIVERFQVSAINLVAMSKDAPFAGGSGSFVAAKDMIRSLQDGRVYGQAQRRRKLWGLI